MAVSCNKNSAKDVATTWLNGFYHMDYEAAKKVSTEDTKNLIATMQQLTGVIPDSNKAEIKKIKITVKDVKEKGDTAVATYTISDTPGKDQTLNLIKKDGKWLVQFSKNDQMGGGGAENNADQPMGADSTATPAEATMSDTTKH